MLLTCKVWHRNMRTVTVSAVTVHSNCVKHGKRKKKHHSEQFVSVLEIFTEG